MSAISLDTSVDDMALRHLRRAMDDKGRDAWVLSAEKLREAQISSAILKDYARFSAEAETLFGNAGFSDLVTSVDHLRLHAGAGAAVALIANLPSAHRHVADAEDFRIWLQALCDLSELAPKCVVDICGKTQSLLSKLDAIGFSRWVATGATSTAGDTQKIARYFSLQEPASREVLELESGTVRPTEIEKSLTSLPLGFWKQRVILRATGFSSGTKHLRTSFDDTYIRLPASFDGVRGDLAEDMFRAAVTHVGAHIAFSGERRKPKALKPIQLAIISILEDSRVELLAGRRYPGLLKFWTSLHTIAGHSRAIREGDQNCACHVVADSAPVTENLLARLARALIDETYEDESPWVQKGRKLFFDAGPDWDDPEAIRRIGVLLGNDLGQMRLQFNAKTYVVEPPYRDDNLGIWDFGDPSEQASEDLDMVTNSVRIEHEEQVTASQYQNASDKPDHSAKSKPVRPDEDQGVPVSKQPEWDYLAASYRPNWVTVTEHNARAAPAGIIDARIAQHADIAARIEVLVRQSKVGQSKRLRRQREGDRLDLDACIRHRIDTRAGQDPDIGIYETSGFSARDLAVLVLLDISESTKDLINGTATSVFHLERDATALLAHAMDAMGDPFAIHAFCSNGRSELRYLRIKDFGAPYNDLAKSKLAGMRPGYSTRMGGALRCAATSIGIQQTRRKLVLVVTDGEPSDIDVADPDYLIEDSRKAVVELASQGIDVFAVGLDGSGKSDLSRIFGHRNTIDIDNVSSLPERLPMLYFRLVG